MQSKKVYIKPEISVTSVIREDIILTSYEFSIGKGSKNVLGGSNVLKGSDGFGDIWRN